MALSPEVAKIIQEAVKIGGKALEGKLPPKSFLPKRNPYAHLYERIKARHLIDSEEYNKFRKMFKNMENFNWEGR